MPTSIAADAQLACKHDRNNNIEVRVEWMKDRNSEGQVVASSLKSVEVGTDADSEPITSCVVVAAEATLSQAKPKKLPANQQTMLHLLQDAGKEGLTLLQWNTKAKEQGIGTKRHSTLYEAERALKEAKLVHSYADRRYT